MKICETSKIDSDAGDYCVLMDGGSEGMSLASQHSTLNEAVLALGKNNYGAPQVLVKIVDFAITVNERENEGENEGGNHE